MSALSRLAAVDEIAMGDIQTLAYDLSDAEEELSQAETRIREQSGMAEQTKKLSDEIQDLNTRELTASQKVGDLKRSLEGLRGQLASKNADLQRVNEQLGRSRPALKKAQKAESISLIIDEMIREMYPLKVRDVALAMTRIYKQLAHKKLLDHVEISEDCEVLLLDRHGNDLRRFDASAGENQIFAIALISAIAEVSGAKFPLVVDTPLARLDERHRTSVLAHLASYPGQVILLSATDEVAGKYLDAIRNRVGSTYHLKFEELDIGIGLTSVIPGYLEAIK